MGVSDIEVVQQNQCFPVSHSAVQHGNQRQKYNDSVI